MYNQNKYFINQYPGCVFSELFSLMCSGHSPLNWFLRLLNEGQHAGGSVDGEEKPWQPPLWVRWPWVPLPALPPLAE